MNVTLSEALKQLRLSGLSSTLDVRLQSALENTCSRSLCAGINSRAR